MSRQFIAALDEGTSSARFAIYDEQRRMIVHHQIPIQSLYPQEGWVEQDPQVILEIVLECIHEGVQKFLALGHQITEIKGLGITNQRETTIIWDKTTGRPLHNAIVWSDSRTKEMTDQMKASTDESIVLEMKKKSGLPLHPYFSATKIKWLLENVKVVKEEVANSESAKETAFQTGMWNVNTVGKEGLGGQASVNGLVVPPSHHNTTQMVEEETVNVVDIETLQSKLNELWGKLMMSPMKRMSLLIKYSSAKFMANIIASFRENHSAVGPLNETYSLWASVVDAILQRERCLAKLEEFERVASNPARFFAKGDPELTSNRLKESRDRGRIQRELKAISAAVIKYLDLILARFGDRVTFANRDYRDKMKYDQIEMLYWLQQERRQQALQTTALVLPPLVDSGLSNTATLSEGRIGTKL